MSGKFAEEMLQLLIGWRANNGETVAKELSKLEETTFGLLDPQASHLFLSESNVLR